MIGCVSHHGELVWGGRHAIAPKLSLTDNQHYLLPDCCGENLAQPQHVSRDENGRKEGCDSTIVTHRGSSANWPKAAMAGSVHAAGEEAEGAR